MYIIIINFRQILVVRSIKMIPKTINNKIPINKYTENSKTNLELHVFLNFLNV